MSFLSTDKNHIHNLTGNVCATITHIQTLFWQNFFICISDMQAMFCLMKQLCMRYQYWATKSSHSLKYLEGTQIHCFYNFSQWTIWKSMRQLEDYHLPSFILSPKFIYKHMRTMKMISAHKTFCRMTIFRHLLIISRFNLIGLKCLGSYCEQRCFIE